MSWEAYGDDSEYVIDPDTFERADWESDADGERWWRIGEPETTYRPLFASPTRSELHGQATRAELMDATGVMR